MAFYLGDSGKQRVIVNNITYRINCISDVPDINGIRLLSSEGYILKDTNDVYLTSKEGE